MHRIEIFCDVFVYCETKIRFISSAAENEETALFEWEERTPTFGQSQYRKAFTSGSKESIISNEHEFSSKKCRLS